MPTRSVIGMCLITTSLACDAGRGEVPRYVTLIHCEPHAASLLDWISLVNLVEAANGKGIVLTIQFSPQWVPLVGPHADRRKAVANWQVDGNEISGHHHTITHVESWDGYSNNATAPFSDREPGFLGDMQDWRWKVSELLPQDTVLQTASSWDSDFPAGVRFQTGGDGGAGVNQATSQPALKWINDRPVWNLTSAALYRGGKWYNDPLEALFQAAGEDDVFTVAFHPSDYHPNDTEPVDSWLDFLAAQDPGGKRSSIPVEILETFAFTPGDVNYDELVDVEDLLVLIAEWDTADPDADVNADGIVDISDLLTLLEHWTSS